MSTHAHNAVWMLEHHERATRVPATLMPHDYSFGHDSPNQVDWELRYRVDRRMFTRCELARRLDAQLYAVLASRCP